MTNYLQTGRSAKYDSVKILGRWDFDVSASLKALEQSRQNMTSGEMQELRALWPSAYAQTTFAAGADGQTFLKSLPNFTAHQNQAGTTETANWQGRWISDGDNYTLSFDSNGAHKSATATVADTRLIIKTTSDTMIFDRED